MLNDRQTLIKIGLSLIANALGASFVAPVILTYSILTEFIRDDTYFGRGASETGFNIISGITLLIVLLLLPALSTYLLRSVFTHNLVLALYLIGLCIMDTAITWGCLFIVYIAL